MSGPVVDHDGVTFRYQAGAAQDARIRRLSLVQEVAWPRVGPGFARCNGDGWWARFDRPDVDRFEYRFQLELADGTTALLLDPTNPVTAPGAFGERSVIEFPGYRAPTWVRSDPPRGPVRELTLPSAALGGDQPALLWSAHGTDPAAELPILVALDGVELAGFSGLLHALDAQVARRRLPDMRALLLHPTSRDRHYSADPAFAEALATELLPAAAEQAPTPDDPRTRVGLGTSLGALALLHAQRSRPTCFGGLFLQSGSFFQDPRQDAQAGGFEYLPRILAFTAGVLSAGTWSAPVPTVLTCGVVEPNWANNRSMVRALRRQGYPASLHRTRDAHNWVAWRDAWTPHLVALLRKLWR